MSNKIITLLAAITFFTLLSQEVYSQKEYSLKAIYNLTFKADRTNLADIREEPMILFIGQTSSKFMSYNVFKRDSVEPGLSKNRESQIASDAASFSDYMSALRRVAPSSRFMFRIYNEFDTGKTTVYDQVWTDKFVYQEETPLAWNLTGLTDTIRGYPCQKATTLFGGREWTVWFTPDIPFPAGPYKFTGLPGLILKVEDSRSHYVFKLSSIIRQETKQPYPPYPNAIRTTKKDFFQNHE